MFYTFYRKKLRKNFNFRIIQTGTGYGTVFPEADPDPHQDEVETLAQTIFFIGRTTKRGRGLSILERLSICYGYE